ncbi:MAG: dTMP kinase, partial [Pseudomonadota bacterium]
MTEVASKRGVFITLEGGEGAGKSTQIRRLDEKLQSLGFDTLLTREPGGTPGAEAIRHVILSGFAEQFGADVEAMLFSAARSDHVTHVIKPALEAGKLVICDRFFDSTRVYQGASGKVDMAFLKSLEKIACEDAWPDLTLILDLDPEEGMRRAGTRREEGAKPDRFEKENMENQKIRRDAFRKIVEDEPERCVLVNANGSEEEVAQRIWEAVEPRLN